MTVDVLLVSLGTTAGLRAAERELAGSLGRAGAVVEVARAAPTRSVRTFALTDLVQARAARRAAVVGIERFSPRTIVYCTSTAALLWPRPGAIYFDAPAAGNRPGRHGIWQRAVERRCFAATPLLLAWSEGGRAEAPAHDEAVVVPFPVEPSAAGDDDVGRDVAVVTYAADVEKKGLATVLEAWARERRPGEELVVAGRPPGGRPVDGVRYAGLLAPEGFRRLLRRAHVYVTAPRREDYGIAQLEALADGCRLVTTPAPGPYVALPIARQLDPRLVADDLAPALRSALDDPRPGYEQAAAAAVAPFTRAAVDAVVAGEVLPRLLAGTA